MKTATFKTMLKENKKALIGRELTIYVGAGDWAEVYTSLHEFGNRILELEIRGYEFSFEDSLTKVRASYYNHIELTLEQRTAGIKAFGTAA